MTLRVTNDYSTAQFIQQIFDQRKALEESREKISTGIEIASPGDDPGKAAMISQFQHTISRLTRHRERIDFLDGVMMHQESTLENANTLMIRAKEIANQAANETNSVESRAQLAAEVLELRDAMVEAANTQYQGRYVYGGAADDTPPFIASATPYTNPATGPEKVRYVFDSAAPGRTQTRSVQVSDDDTIQVTTSGQMFEEAISALERLGRALSGYRTDPEDLSTLPTGTGAAYTFPADFDDQTTAIINTIDVFESKRQEFQREIASLGGRTNRMNQAKQFVDTIIFNTEKARASFQEADPIESIAEFQNLESSLQSLLAAGARINNLSLLDYI